MKTPKQLTGEVKRFIDEYYLIGKFRLEYSRHSPETMNEVCDFYNQPFKPSMITEYFEGFVKQNVSGRVIGVRWSYVLNGVEIYYFDDKDYPKHRDRLCVDMYNSGTADDDYNLPCPKTLSDFITFCLSVGILLRWK